MTRREACGLNIVAETKLFVTFDISTRAAASRAVHCSSLPLPHSPRPTTVDKLTDTVAWLLSLFTKSSATEDLPQAEKGSGTCNLFEYTNQAGILQGLP